MKICFCLFCSFYKGPPPPQWFGDIAKGFEDIAKWFGDIAKGFGDIAKGFQDCLAGGCSSRLNPPDGLAVRRCRGLKRFEQPPPSTLEIF